MMAKSPITSEVERWLKSNHKHHSHRELASHIGCCLDTLKRALVRLDLEVIYGAKYQRRTASKKWSRPCITCGSTKPRPRYQYKCGPCHERINDLERVNLNKKRRTDVSLSRME